MNQILEEDTILENDKNKGTGSILDYVRMMRSNGRFDMQEVIDEYKKVNLNHLNAMERIDKFILSNEVTNESVTTKMSLKSIEELLPANKFVKVHRSFIINFNEVSVIERNNIVYENKTYIPISEQYKDNFQKRIDNDRSSTLI